MSAGCGKILLFHRSGPGLVSCRLTNPFIPLPLRGAAQIRRWASGETRPKIEDASLIRGSFAHQSPDNTMINHKRIQLVGSSREPVRRLMEDVRLAVSRACSGVDDMHLLGSKALVVRAEISPKQLPVLVSALEALRVDIDRTSVPSPAALDRAALYPLTVQVTSFSDDTDGRVTIPHVPG
ncbi:hypothetical protein H0E82_12085 [Luteimonas sp. SJ-16]|uniref:Uncharacterized protein n=2 Tax=Luteimonas deserti TaxID=2752306 RepID=A0A7Z0QUX8_9GAMM|nr:hypothetical protein [Luteimonas deserti]